MKQKLRVFLTLLLCAVASVGWAEEETLDFTAQNYSNQEGVSILTGTNVKVDLGKGTGSNAPAYYTTGTAVRLYGGGYMIVSTLDETKVLTKLVITYYGSDKPSSNNFSIDSGNYDASTNTWTGSSSSVKFTNTASKGHWKIQKIVVTYQEAGSTDETCATPSFTPAGGVYTSAQDVTITTTTDGATIYYTTDGTEPTTSSSVYSSAISVSQTTTIKAIAVKAGLDNSTVATATYTIVNLQHAGTEADPYTVADAIALLSADPAALYENVYVKGIISQIDSYNDRYHSITYWISDDGETTTQFEVYSGKGLNGADFSATTDLTVGNSVVVKGTIKKYNSTYEFDINSEIVSMEEVTFPVINANEALQLAYDATSGSFEYSITNPVVGKSLTATTTAEWISNIQVGEGSVTFTTTQNDGTANRTATITLAYEGAESVEVTVTQKYYVADYATLPFEFNGGRADIETIAGLSQSELGTDYKDAPYLKFDTTGDELVLHFNERPGKLTFDIKGNSFSGGTFKVQTSADGTTYSDLETYTQFGNTTQSEEFNTLGENVRYIKWVYTEKVSGNVALGNITLAEYSETPVETPTVNVGTLTNVTIAKMWIGDDNLTDIEDGAEVEAGTEVFVEFTVAEGYTFESFNVVDADGNEVTVTENTGNWSFVMPESNVTITATATENTPAGDKTLTNANIVAAGNGDTSYKEWTITDTNGKDWKAYAIKNQHSKATSGYHYLQIKKYASNTAYYIQVPEYGTKILKLEMTVSGSNQPMDGGSNNATLFFSADNTTSAAGEGVVSGTGANKVVINCSDLNLNTGYITAGGAVRIWDVKVTYEEASQEAVPVSISSVGMATFSSTKALDFSGVKDIYAYTAQVEGSKVNFTRVYKVPTNTGLLLRNPNGERAEAQVPVITEAEAETVNNNALVAVAETIENLPTVNNENGGTNYILNKKNNNIGFYKAAGNTVDAGKAYLVIPVGVSVRDFIGFDDETDGIKQIEKLAIDNAEIYNLSGQRVNNAQKGIYIVNGKKVVVK